MKKETRVMFELQVKDLSSIVFDGPFTLSTAETILAFLTPEVESWLFFIYHFRLFPKR